MKSPTHNPAQFATSLSEKAYLLVRDKILRGQIPMGGAISRRQLATEFGMSFLPVNEAVQRLESEGLVESRPRVGTRVRIPTPSDIRERYIVREALETQSARLFAERASSDEKRSLRGMARRLDDAAQSVSSSLEEQLEFQTLHFQFHNQIAYWAGSSLLCEMLERNQLLVDNWLFSISAECPTTCWHSELTNVLVNNDPDAAGLAMGRHIRTGMIDIQEAIARRFTVNLPPLGRIARDREVAPTSHDAQATAPSSADEKPKRLSAGGGRSKKIASKK